VQGAIQQTIRVRTGGTSDPMHERGSTVAIAWGGAALFAASQLWFLYCYFIRFDRLPPSGFGVGGATTIDLLLFTVFALHHSVLARPGPKQFMERLVSPELERSLYTWIASALFIVVCTAWVPVPGTVYRLEPPWRFAGYAVQALGIVLTVRASRALDVLELAGVRQAEPATEVNHTGLKTTGLYGFVRHPLYFAWTLLVFGSPDMAATRFTFAVISTGYLALAIPWEERGLLATFGKDYEAYRKAVRWRMVPGLY
jgi:protein-S-isoprenylcysteine O-methyltransferase Ste14